MRYEILKFQYEAPKKETVFVIPVSSQADQHTVLYPRSLKKSADSQVEVRYFAGCGAETRDWVKDSLQKLLETTLKKEKQRSQNIFMVSISMAVLAVISWAFPDPLPLLDEVILTLGAGGLGLLSYLQYRNARKAALSSGDHTPALEIVEDPVLTRVFQAMEGMDKPDWNEAIRSGSRDLVELESEGMVHLVDVEGMIRSEEISEKDLRLTVTSLSKTLSLGLLLSLEEQGRDGKDRSKTRLKRLRESLRRRFGITETGQIVYTELYRHTRDYFRNKGIPLE